jgi:hypothetical protein
MYIYNKGGVGNSIGNKRLIKIMRAPTNENPSQKNNDRDLVNSPPRRNSLVKGSGKRRGSVQKENPHISGKEEVVIDVAIASESLTPIRKKILTTRSLDNQQTNHPLAVTRTPSFPQVFMYIHLFMYIYVYVHMCIVHMHIRV